MSSLPSQKAWQGLLRRAVGFAPVAWLGPIVEANVSSDAEGIMYVQASNQDEEWWGTITPEIINVFFESLHIIEEN